MVVALEASGVVLQFNKVEPTTTEDQQIDFVPAPVSVPELEVRPGPERPLVREQVADVPQTLGLVRELRRRHLDPPRADRCWHAVPSVALNTFPEPGSP